MDGLLDLADPGCGSPFDDNEVDLMGDPPTCANDVDDDEDGQTDFPADPDCDAAGDVTEALRCELDNPVVEVPFEGGVFPFVRTQGADLSQGSCGNGRGAATVYALDLVEPARVRVTVTRDGVPSRGIIYVRTLCDDPESETECDAPRQAPRDLELDDAPRGVLYVFVETPGTGDGFEVAFEIISNVTECNDELDNDGDGVIDLADLGCEAGNDVSERDPEVRPACSDGVDNDGNGQTDWPADAGCRAAGDLEEAPPCQGMFFGDVCLVHLSQVCVGGSSVDYCAMFGAEVITLAEFQSIVAQGWVRPDDGYHTIAVAEDFGNCPGDGYSNVGIPGWGEFGLFQCGEDANYCNRAIACVTR